MLVKQYKRSASAQRWHQLSGYCFGLHSTTLLVLQGATAANSLQSAQHAAYPAEPDVWWNCGGNYNSIDAARLLQVCKTHRLPM